MEARREQEGLTVSSAFPLPLCSGK